MIQMITAYDMKLVFVQKITFVLRKINKNQSSRLDVIGPDMLLF